MHVLDRNQVLELQAHLDAIAAVLKASEISLGDLVQNPSRTKKFGRYEACVMGDQLSANTLPKLVVGIIEWFEEHDPTVLERLAVEEAQIRRFISKRREVIHPGRNDLPVIQSASGWYTSANIGFEDARRWAKAASTAAGLDSNSVITIKRNTP